MDKAVNYDQYIDNLRYRMTDEEFIYFDDEYDLAIRRNFINKRITFEYDGSFFFDFKHESIEHLKRLLSLARDVRRKSRHQLLVEHIKNEGFERKFGGIYMKVIDGIEVAINKDQKTVHAMIEGKECIGSVRTIEHVYKYINILLH